MASHLSRALQNFLEQSKEEFPFNPLIHSDWIIIQRKGKQAQRAYVFKSDGFHE